MYSQTKNGPGTEVMRKGRKLNSGIPAKVMINRGGPNGVVIAGG